MTEGARSQKGRCLHVFDPYIWMGICVSRPVGTDTCQGASQRLQDDGQGCIHLKDNSGKVYRPLPGTAASRRAQGTAQGALLHQELF